MISRRFLHLADGQDLIEYSLLVGMLAVAIVFAITDTGTTVAGLYADAASVLSGDSGAEGPAGEPADPLGGDPGGGDPGSGNPGGGNPNPGNGNPNPGNGNPNPGGGSPGGGKGK